MTQILDQYGAPIRKTELKQDYAGPTVGGVRPVISGHPAAGLNPVRLAQIHLAAAQGDPLAYFELAEDIEERDLHYLGVISTRKRSVAQLPITVTAASEDAAHKKHAEFIQSWISDGILQAGLFDMLDAIGKGHSVMEINWRSHMGHLCPSELVYRPQRWFEFDPLDGETILLRDGGKAEPLPEHLFIIHRHKSKSGLTVRSGLARVASWAWMYKSFTLKDWAIFTQNYGMPIRVGKYERNATAEEKDVLWRAVRNIAGDCAAIVPQGMEMEFIEVKSQGAATEGYEKRADWFDRQISKAVLGQTTTTDAVSGGHAVAKEHRLVQEDIERADAMLLTATVNRQLVPNIIAFNFGPQDHYPKLSIGRPDEVPLDEFTAAFDKLATHGLTADASYLRSRLGIPQPAGDAELVGGRKPSLSDPLFGGAPREGARPSVHSQELTRLLNGRADKARSDAIIDRLNERMARDAAGALAGLTEDVKAIILGAKDLPDAAAQLAGLQLAPERLAEAMARSMALAQLVGQAAVLDDMAAQE